MTPHSASEMAPGEQKSAVTIGFFDGVHAGHRELMRRLRAVARERGLTPKVLTFEPHPMKVLAPERAPKLITNLEQRCRLIREQGIAGIEVLRFDTELSALSPEEFVKQILVEKLRARMVLVGENFRFGHRAAGHVGQLAELGSQYGFETVVVPPFCLRGISVSSTEVRKQIAEGGVSLAARLLCRPYALEGAVVSGHGVGAKQTVPTLNLNTAAELLPKNGVYITRTREVVNHGARQWRSITNVGFRPTFGDEERLTIETYLLAPLEGETPETIIVEFLRFVRDERKFVSPGALKDQILRDVERAQTYFRRLRD